MLVGDTVRHMSDLPQLFGREYRRVSKDRFGRQKSTGQQGDENADIRPMFDVTDCGLPPYVDDDRSASRHARQIREDFEQLIDDLKADTFGANVLQLYESSRGSRQVEEWLLLLKLLEQRRILVLVTTHKRMYDPRNHRDRKTLLDDAVEGEYQSEETAVRVRRDAAANAVLGRPHGPIPYGYRRRYDQRTKELIAQEEEAAEAQVIRELVARLLAGHSLKAIAVDFAARGIRNQRGKPFRREYLREMALSPTYAGTRIHFPLLRRDEPDTEADRYHAIWPAIISMADHLAVVALLTDSERTTRRPGSAVHLLSMIMRCHPCSGPMTAHLSRSVPYYRCSESHVTISKPPVDGLVERLLLSVLSPEDAFDRLLGTLPSGAADLTRVRVQLAEAKAEHDALANSGVSVALAARKEPAILKRISELRGRERELATPLALRGLIRPGPTARAQWAAAEMSTRREIGRRMLSEELLGEVHVLPAPRRGAGVPAHSRLVLVRGGVVVPLPVVE